MGTHPIFESDFDCLTEDKKQKKNKDKKNGDQSTNECGGIWP